MACELDGQLGTFRVCGLVASPRGRLVTVIVPLPSGDACAVVLERDDPLGRVAVGDEADLLRLVLLG